MKRSKFTDSQIAFILPQADEGTAVAKVCRKADISEATFYNWRKRFGDMSPSEVRQLRQLEDRCWISHGSSESMTQRSNSCLKNIVAI